MTCYYTVTRVLRVPFCSPGDGGRKKSVTRRSTRADYTRIISQTELCLNYNNNHDQKKKTKKFYAPRLIVTLTRVSLPRESDF